MNVALGLLGLVGGVAVIVWGAETFAEHLGAASSRLGVSAFALALLLAGAEPEELATTVTGSLRHVPAVSFGDVIGANVAMCLVALGVGAIVAPLPFGAQVRRYALWGLPIGVVAVVVAWNGRVGRAEGALLVALYVAYVAIIWIRERRPPMLGEAGELGELGEAGGEGGDRLGAARDVVLVLAGVGGMVGGAVLLVEGLRSLTDIEATQTDVSLTLIGFATAFELVVLAWSAARRGITEAVVAAVVGSFAYNATMSLGAAALANPLRIADAGRLHVPLAVMVGSLVLALALALPRGVLTRRAGMMLVTAYPVFVAYVAVR